MVKSILEKNVNITLKLYISQVLVRSGTIPTVQMIGATKDAEELFALMKFNIHRINL
jgi:hypothetical protein